MLRQVDARFLLPLVPETACVLPGAAVFASGLAEAGIEVVGVVGTAERPLDLVVASSDEAEAALGLSARSYIFVGRPVAALARAGGLEAESYLAIPDVPGAAYLIPLGFPAVLRHVYRRLRVAPSRARWWRGRLLAEALARGVPPPGTRTVTVAAPLSVRPAALTAVEGLVGPGHDGWLLSLGPVRAEGRVVFEVFEGAVPRYVVKCDRRVDVETEVDRVESTARLTEAIASSPLVASVAPRPVGSVQFAGGLVEVETAAVGYRLIIRLRGPFPRKTKLAAIDAVATWLLALAESTLHRRGPSGSYRAPAELDDVPRVICHGDLWSGNVFVDDLYHCQVIDWADVDRSGLPLGDLLLLLSESLAELDDEDTDEGRDRHFVELLTGRRATSAFLFGWVRAMVDALDLEPELVGLVAEAALAAMAERRLLLEGLAPGDPRREAPAALADPVVRRARLWTTTPGLGRSWQAWRYPPPDQVGPGGVAARGGVSFRHTSRRAERSLGHGAGRLAVLLSRDRTDELERGRVLVLAPHPDDETLACGGVLALHRGLDSAFVIVASDGSRGVYGAEPAALAARRREELAAATAALGLAPVQVAWWGFEDGTLSARVDQLGERLGEALDELRPDIVLSPWAFDIHPDHAALGGAARAATAHRPVELLEYVTWAWDRPSELLRGLVRSEAATTSQRADWLPAGRPVAVAITPVLDTKREALACYGSQLGSPGPGAGSEGASLDEAFVELFLRRTELFWPAPHSRRQAH